ncbi:hypothetical protein ATZ33_16965 [Enterococcus silesiacus]|uniref:Signal peptidase I n=1 Tax=Enterococcus silesiacus TaxID=332949 RepID=A0ABM5WE18_9ENTE|nr:hypothetical protein ATZ33_16965 [Enterococcus silesiacus]
MREGLFSLFLLAILVYGQSFFFFSLAKSTSYAMSPTLKFGTYVLVEKTQRIQRLDVVLIKRENAQKTEIKRIIGLPNEKVEYKNDQLFIDDEERTEPFITEEKKSARKNEFMYTKDFTLADLTGETTLAKDCYFVLGDNRLYSTDSREYGLIKRAEIIGVVSTRF